MGRDLPGGILIKSSTEDFYHPHLNSVKEIRSDKMPYRFSLAGIQLKFSALEQKKGGLTIPASGIGGTWIVKLLSVNFFEVPENEYAMMTLAK